MCEYFLADTYKDAEKLGKPYQVNEKLYTRIKHTCPKCSGSGNYKNFGTCFTCHGAGYVIKEARLFTAEEKTAYDAAKKQDDIDSEAIENEAKKNWLIRNGFDSEGNTYVVMGNSYLIKDKLKACGFKYSNYLKWHAAERLDSTLELKQISVHDYYSWVPGTKSYMLTSDGKKKLEELYTIEPPYTEWYGVEGERFIKLKVVLNGIIEKDTQWGEQTSYTFVDNDNHYFIWNTTSWAEIPEGEIYLSATIKKHFLSRNGMKITYIQRAKVEKI